MESPQPASINNELKDHYDHLENTLLKPYLQVLVKKLNEQEEFVGSIKILLEKYHLDLEKSEDRLIPSTRAYHQALKKLIEDQHKGRNQKNFNESFENFNAGMVQYVSCLEHYVIREQDRERFFAQPGDSVVLKFLKSFKRLFFLFSQVPTKTGNALRRILKKPPNPPKVWFHQIPLQEIFDFYFRIELASEMKPILHQTNSFLSDVSQKLHQLTKRPDESIGNLGVQDACAVIISFNLGNASSGLIEEIKNFEKVILEGAHEILQKVFLNFQKTYLKINTIELSGNKFNRQILEKKFSELNESYKKLNEGWSNTYFAIYERWRLDEERFLLKYALCESLYEIKNSFTTRLDFNIIPHLTSIAKILQESEVKVGQFSGTRTELKALLLHERRSILRDLRHKKIPIAVESLIEQQLASLVGQIEIDLENKIEYLPRKTVLSRNNTFSKETKPSDLQNFSLHELLSYDTFPAFRSLLGQTKSTIVRDLDGVQKSLVELNSISDFNLESALAMLEKEDTSVEESALVAKEGLQRASSKCESIGKELSQLRDKVVANLDLAVNEFNKQLDDLSNTDTIFDAQIRIVKAKALSRGKAYKGRALKIFRKIVPFIRNYSHKTTTQTIQYYRKFKDQYGLSSAPSLVSAEISDYLAEVKSSISLLPFVYQRLFDIAPLKDRTFYEERTREIGVLKKAYENWDKGYFAPVVIVGEKGAGATTLLNFFIKDLPTSYKVLKVDEFQSLTDQKMLWDTFNKLFSIDSINGEEEIIDYVNNLQEKRIVIIENLQHFYLRKVGGFDTLKTLLKVMSRTHKKIFWITSCTTYTWRYLEKILDISDFFGYINFLEGLTDEQIIQVILKRHRVSGYNIRFEPSSAIRLSRKYKRLPEVDRQDYLKEQFFMSLNKFAKNNLSLALIYWLRSTKGVKGDVISFGFMNSFKFDFLAAISTEKITILQALLLHNHLSEENISEILSKDLEDCKMLLLLLFDDGIIVKEENGYMINPLLYRQTVNLLQSKNFI